MQAGPKWRESSIQTTPKTKANVANVIHGGQVPDSDLLNAGVDDVREDDVANVDLVKISTVLDASIHTLSLH